ncbi:MAG: hypothetical protein J5777_05085 [Clostridiales bacterium]|nr:hypothetical protein [Clostridiales bacterium]
MKKTVSKALVFVMMLTAVFAVTACGGKKSEITSNWKFESISVDGKTTRAANLDEDEQPMVVIDEDKLNPGTYTLIYRQTGKNHRATMTAEYGSYRINYVDSDRDMIAKVMGDKLTLVMEGRNGASIVFRATEEEMLIPVDDKTGPDYIKARMTDKGKVEITNEGTEEYTYGKCYQLEVMKNGKWCYARTIESYAWTELAYSLPAGETATEEYNLSHFGTLKPGEYRLAVCNLEACIYAYFTVNADGTYTYAK